MKDRIFRIALASLGVPLNDNQAKEILYGLFDDIKNKKIQNVDQFFSKLEYHSIDSRKLAEIVSKIVKGDEKERIIQVGLFMGQGANNSGLGIIAPSWFERNISDEKLYKVIPEKFWKLFRKEEWLKKNKITV
jgi:hypothetical protein